MLERRIGSFSLSENLLKQVSHIKLKSLFSKFIIVRCEYNYYAGEFEYLAYCSQFWKVRDQHAATPHYTVNVDLVDIFMIPPSGKLEDKFKIGSIR